jgi:hypothetical protein
MKKKNFTLLAGALMSLATIFGANAQDVGYRQIDKPGLFKFYSTHNPYEVLTEITEGDYAVPGKSMLGFVHLLLYPDANPAIYVHPVHITGAAKPQYLLAVGQTTGPEYVRGRFLFNAKDLANNLPADNNPYRWSGRYRLTFLEGIYKSDMLYILGNEEYDPATSNFTLDELVETGRITKMDLNDGSPKTCLFSFPLIENGSSDFFIASDADEDCWITLQNGSAVITYAHYPEVYIEAAFFNMKAIDPTPTDTVSVTPNNIRNMLEVAFEIPADEHFTATFTLTLPAGFVLNQQETALAPELRNDYRLSIMPVAGGGWTFEITPKPSAGSAAETTLRVGETGYRKVLDIAYTTDESVNEGSYEVKLQNIDITLSDGTVIHRDEISARVEIDATGNAVVETAKVTYHNGILSINTPMSEQIEVYSVSGALLYRARKASGKATFRLNHLPKGVLIIKGSSGWVKKIVNV